MMDGQCRSCGRYLWDQQVYERAEEFRRDRERLLADLERYKADMKYLLTCLKSEREACARVCDIIAEDAAEIFDRDAETAARMCSVLIRARGFRDDD